MRGLHPALVLYEHAITLGTEVQQIWSRRLSGATVLFIMTRYLIFLDQILVMISLSAIRTLEVRPQHRLYSCRLLILPPRGQC